MGERVDSRFGPGVQGPLNPVAGTAKEQRDDFKGERDRITEHLIPDEDKLYGMFVEGKFG